MKSNFSDNLLSQLGKDILFFDGGTGSVLQSWGLRPGELPETWNILQPKKIIDLHFNYFLAGCNIIKTNTFGANSLKFPQKNATFLFEKEANTLPFLEDVVSSAIQNAQEARRLIENLSLHQEEISLLKEKYLFPKTKNPQQVPHYIALDIGPLGKLLEPLGDISFDCAVEIFSNTYRAAFNNESSILPDLILIETMNDCYEAKAAIIAAKEVLLEHNLSLPIFVTTVYDESGTLLTGANPETMTTILEGLGVTAFGMNCSLGPKQMKNILPELTKNASVPIIVNPNAGLPRSENNSIIYDVTPTEFAEIVASFIDDGASILGGCCGTTPEHICNLVDACNKKKCPEIQEKNISCVSSHIKTVKFGDYPILVGERINPTGKKRFKEALRQNDIPYIINEGLSQESKGVHILDVNVGLPEIDEPTMLCSVVKELQSVTTLPLQLDTSDLTAMEQAMRIYNGKPLINSVNGKLEVMEKIFPLVKKYGGIVVALTLDEQGIPDTAKGRVAIAKKIYAKAAEYGIAAKNIIIDPLAMAVSSDTKAAKTTLDTLKFIHQELQGLSILGVSNISFGLPQREIITAAFFTMAMQNGLSAAIMNPNSTEMIKAYKCFCTLSGFDDNCCEYISFAQSYHIEMESKTIDKISNSNSDISLQSFSEGSLEYAIVRGLKREATEITKNLLQHEQPLDIINQHLIPALDFVGKGFEAKTIYLPQLLMSAEATKSAFSVVKEKISANGNEEIKGIIAIATVKGDIHDIGKNIVKTLLENYGYKVLDLRKDVPPEEIALCVQENNLQLVGLSALMTTTVPSMEETIKLIRKNSPNCKVCVGGAVLTQEYATMIGADFYAKDALETVKYAHQVFSK